MTLGEERENDKGGGERVKRSGKKERRRTDVPERAVDLPKGKRVAGRTGDQRTELRGSHQQRGSQ